MEFNILECKRFVVPCREFTHQRLVHNYELDFYITGPRTIKIDGCVHEISDNTICFRRPGQLVSSKGDFNCYLLTLDFSKKTPIENYIRNTADLMEPSFTHPLIDSLPDLFSPLHNEEIRSILSMLASRTRLNTDANALLVKQLFYLLNSDLCRSEFEAFNIKQSHTDVIADYLNKNFRKRISLDELAEITHMDKSYIVRLFKKQYHTTPIDYLIELRMDYAIRILTTTNMTINEISDECGYTTASFFTRQFKKRYNMTPGEYRKKCLVQP